MISILEQFSFIISELNRLTGLKFTDGNPKNPLDYSLKRIFEFHNQGNYKYRDYQLAKALFLVKHLKEIEIYDKKLLKNFKMQLKQHIFKENSFQNYFGFRFEVYVTASLIRKNISFEKRESPDFKIYFHEANIFIECASCNLTQKHITDVRYKISSIINKKSKKSYCNNSTSLFIDITNLYFHNMHRINFINENDFTNLKDYVKDVVRQSTFGNVTLFTTYINKELDTIETGYIRVDNENIDNILQKFLDENYPFGNILVGKYLFPDQG